MNHRIPLFLTLRLFVRRFQMPLEELRFAKTLVIFRIMNVTDSLIQNITWKVVSVDSFFKLKTLETMLIYAPIFKKSD